MTKSPDKYPEYVVLPCALSNLKLWTIQCPLNKISTIYARSRNLGFSSCFHDGKIFTSNEEIDKFSVSAYTFPGMLIARILDNTSDFISSVVSKNNTFYNKIVLSDYLMDPTVKYVQTNNILSSSYIFLVSMNVVTVSVEFSYQMYRNQHILFERLSEIDYGTGIAYNAIIPILWACKVTDNVKNPAINAIFVVNGVVETNFVKKIIERSITIIMSTFNITTPRPEYIFQASVTQFDRDIRDSNMDLFYIHKNLCDAFNQGTDDFSCKQKFKASFISTFGTKIFKDGIALNEIETFRNNEYHQELSTVIGIGNIEISSSDDFQCPYKTVQQNLGKQNTNCFLCKSGTYFKNGICIPCNRIDSDLCSLPLQIRECSWIDNAKCIDTL